MASTSSGRTEGDLVRLRLPGDPVYGRLARIATTSVARRLGHSFRQREDLALAVDEAVILLLQTQDGAPAPEHLVLELVQVRGELELVLRSDDSDGAGPLPAPAAARFEALAPGMVPWWQVDVVGRRVELRTGAATG